MRSHEVGALLRRPFNVLKYQLERLLLRGASARLLVIALLVAVVSVAGGMALVAVDDSEGPRSAVWWAFLRLTDPGYLGDDEGVARRVVSTVLTVSGYVLFMGSLVAIMTQWLNQNIQTLARGLTPIAMRGHLVVVGWTSRTAVIAREMFESVVQVRRFLALYETTALRLVFLVEHLDPELREDLRRRVGPRWRERDVAMRSGSALEIHDLMRVDLAHASAVLLPADDVGASEGTTDAAIVKTLLSMRQHLAEVATEELPLVVTELFDAQKLSVARRAYPGPLEVVCSDQLAGQLLAMMMLNPGLGPVLDELLAFGIGNEVHIVDAPDLVGSSVADIRRRLDQAVLLGFVRPRGRSFEPDLCPPSEQAMAATDRLVVVAADLDEATPGAPVSTGSTSSEVSSTTATPTAEVRRVLIVGWSDRVPDLVDELYNHHGSLEVDVLSSVASSTREQHLQVLQQHEPTNRHEMVRMLEGDVTRRAVIGRHLSAGYDRIVLIASDWLATGAQSDARTVLTYLLVRDELQRRKLDTPLVVELMDASNRALLQDGDAEVLVSPLVIGRILAHVTLRRELRAVYDELFDAAGPAVRLRSASDYDLAAGEATTEELARRVEGEGDVLLGLLSPESADGVALARPRGSRWAVEPGTQLVVLGPARAT